MLRICNLNVNHFELEVKTTANFAAKGVHKQAKKFAVNILRI